MRPLSAAGAALLGAGCAAGLVTLDHRLPAPARRALERTSFDGSAVTLAEGPAWVAATAIAAAAAGDATALGCVLGSGAAGLVDDLVGDAGTKGVRGHLGALRRGRVSTGSLKIVTIIGAAAWAARREAGGERAWLLVDAGVIAGTANLLNLFDLRPGRALKVGCLIGLPLLTRPAGRPALAAGLGAGLGVLPHDLAGRSILGDCGANALGSLLGLSAVRALRPTTRAGVLGGVLALTLASERISFTRVIEATPALRALDQLGRSRPEGAKR
ncbi:hypothetical protein GCM10022199_20820 [Marihabitans asiaticum]|uniref:UDP-N-acetylmuramyl pentapeptide phosphotransferase/UDP-N-acetylglucosamine-1-phosphate transferase n=1 Tax=Marihabitans asiaticum TaxID=415218 RepID=A0A560WAK6_9MICO|nr:hypothetical protein [Marihabitans asiaticum]TWD14663.1 hypothetical protein FB557_2085 [Marihabitans asiaticum]